MTGKTRELLLECKKAGYEQVTVLVRDKRIKISQRIKSGSWFGDEHVGEDAPNTPIKVICCQPHRYGEIPPYPHTIYPGDGWPLIWGIVLKCGLIAGLSFGGYGFEDCHDIHPNFIDSLTPGYYDLAKLKE